MPLFTVYNPYVAPKSSSPAEPTLPSPEAFWKWAKQIPVASRDKSYGPIRPWGTQIHLAHEIFTGLAEGYHQFVVHKGGQIGATMVGQLIATYWLTEFAGTQGAFVSNADDVSAFCRENISTMVKTVQKKCVPRVVNKSML